MSSSTSSPVPLNPDVKRLALENLERFRKELRLSLQPEPVFVTDPFGPMNVSKIMEEIEAETPAGAYHAAAWSKSEESILEEQRKAARHSQ